MILEKLTLGFIPLTDAAPLIVAKEEGIFADLGLDVTLSRETSWARLRDKLASGMIDGAHLLQPMAVASAVDLCPGEERFVTACALNLNGNAVTFGNALCAEMDAVGPVGDDRVKGAGKALQQVARARLAAGRPTITLGIPYPFSTHNYLLRFWLADAGLHPDRDVRLIAAPPPHMVDLCEHGRIDGFCVGEPWNSLAVERKIGRAIVSGADIWSAAPEKVFGVREGFVEKRGDTHTRLVRGILRAVRRLEDDEGRGQAADYLSRPLYLNLPASVIARSFSPARTQAGASRFDASYGAYPWPSKAAWIAVQMIRWGQLQDGRRLLERMRKAFRTDIYREAAAAEGIESPTNTDEVLEGAFTERALSGRDDVRNGRFLDGSFFRAENPIGYLERFHRHSIRRPLDEIFNR